jgi:hypothetical protein
VPPPTAAGLAMQLGYLGALVDAVPALRSALRSGVQSAPTLRRMTRRTPSELAHAVAWIEESCDNRASAAHLVDLLELVDGPSGTTARNSDQSSIGPETLNSPFAGAGLLVPALRDSGLGSRLGSAGVHGVLVAALGRSVSARARADPALRWLAGLPDRELSDGVIDWPSGEELELEPSAALADEQFGAGPEFPVVRAVAARFAMGLRGMAGSSLGYLSRQFFLRGGTLVRTDTDLTLRLRSVPLRILLQMAGRLGDRGSVDWINGRRLILEVDDG